MSGTDEILTLLLRGEEETSASLENVDWEAGPFCHNWRNYVTDEVRLIWDRLSEESRAVAYVQAVQESRGEFWD